MMLQSCYAVFATSILNSVSFHCFLAHIELEKDRAFLLLGSKFRGHAKEDAKQQPATWMDFLTRKKKNAKKLSLPTFVKPQPVSWL